MDSLQESSVIYIIDPILANVGMVEQFLTPSFLIVVLLVIKEIIQIRIKIKIKKKVKGKGHMNKKHKKSS